MGDIASTSCEWNQKENREAYDDEFHANANWLIGEKTNWFLCDECEKLPRFKKYKKREKL